MLKVRFPNGQCITYNKANYCSTSTTHHTLYNDAKPEKDWIASVSLDCIIEAAVYCRVENPIIDLTVDKAFRMVIESLEEKETVGNLSHMKKLLRGYNATTLEWKDSE